MTDKMKMQVATVQFTKGDVSLLSHSQRMGDDDEYRWLFNVPQIVGQNGLAMPEGDDVVTEYYASTEKERDEMAEKLLDAVATGRAKAQELASQVTDAFTAALPKEASTNPSA